MSVDTIRGSSELAIREWIQCEYCERVWDVESEQAPPTCPSCKREADRQAARTEAIIPTKWISSGDTLDEIAELFDERAEVARELYESGWRTDSTLGGPNEVVAEPRPEGEREPREPISEETWNSYANDSQSDGIGLLDAIIGVCPQCEGEIHVRYDEWKVDGKVVAKDEMLCRGCDSVVQKNAMEISYTDYPKLHFKDLGSLRTAALHLKGTAGWYRALQDEGWYLVSSIDNHARMRHEISGIEQVELSDEGHLLELHE